MARTEPTPGATRRKAAATSQPPSSAPVHGPKNLTVRRTRDFADDLAVLTSAVQHDGTKLNATAAVHRAMRFLADAYRGAWDYADVPDGTAPDVVAVRYRTAVGQPEPEPVVRAHVVHRSLDTSEEPGSAHARK